MQAKFVSIEELADFFSVSVSTVRVWIKNGTLTSNDFLKIGNTYRFKVSEIELALRRSAANTLDAHEVDKSSTDSSENSLQEKQAELPQISTRTQELAGPTSIEVTNQIEIQIQLLYEIYENILQSITAREAEIWRVRFDEGANWKKLGQRMNLSPSWVKRLFDRSCRKMKHPSRMDNFSNRVEAIFSGNNRYSIPAKELEVRLMLKDEGLYFFYLAIYGGEWSRDPKV